LVLREADKTAHFRSRLEVYQKGASLLKKSLSDHSVVQDSAEIPGDKTETLQKQRLLAPERAPENGTKEFSNTLDRF